MTRRAFFTLGAGMTMAGVARAQYPYPPQGGYPYGAPPPPPPPPYGEDPRYRDPRYGDPRADDYRYRGPPPGGPGPREREREFNREVARLQEERNRGVVALQEEYNRGRITRGQLAAEAGALDRRMNAEIEERRRYVDR